MVGSLAGVPAQAPLMLKIITAPHSVPEQGVPVYPGSEIASTG